VYRDSPAYPVFLNPFAASVSLEQRIFFLLRLAVLLCFTGHGFWGLAGKESWIPFFNAYFVGEEYARVLMPVIGAWDIAVGLIFFLYPTRALLCYVVFWTLFTATLRPSAGMGMSEFYERAGNYGIPLAMLFVYGFKSGQGWFGRLAPPSTLAAGSEPYKWFELVLRICLFLLLAGHGGLALFNASPVLLRHFATLGITPDQAVLMIFGTCEITLALVVLARPRLPGLMLFVLVFKLFCESIYPFAGQARDVFETIERAGDYIIPLILWMLYNNSTDSKKVVYQGL